MVKLTQNLHAFGHLVAFHLLCYQQTDALFVVVAQHFHELLGLVVFATQTQHENGSGIGVQTDVAQHLAGILVVTR